MLVFRNQRVEIDSFRSSPRTFEGGPISSLKRPRPLGENHPVKNSPYKIITKNVLSQVTADIT